MPAHRLEAVVGGVPPSTREPAGDSSEPLAAAVAALVGEARFNVWFRGHARFVNLGAEVIVVARNDSGRDWLERTFGEAVRSAAADVCGPSVQVRWVVDPAAFPHQARGTEAPLHTAPPPSTNLFGEPVPPAKPKPKKPDADEQDFDRAPASIRTGRKWKLLTEFVVGRCNRVAHASAMAAVDEPGQGANPVVFHGPTGTGKTHLLEGIYFGLRKRLDAKPVYTTAEEFTTRFVQASRLGKMSAFRRHYRECSALLLDNLNFLATKRATQEEFLHTFDSLVADGRQIVVTTDCHPRLADELMPELVDRLVGGAVWSLLPPDAETRLEILRKKSAGRGPVIPDDVLTSIAEVLRGNVRELEGAVHALRHYAKVAGRPVDHALAREALGDLLRHAVRVVTLPDVDGAVCSVLRLSSGTLQSKARTWSVSHPRMLAVYLSRKHTAATYGEISKHFGAKTHSTAVAAEKTVRNWIDRDERVLIGDRDWGAKELVDRIERELQR
ncbi:MAG: DnaA/Hda family protein [Gemmataceae bacterium]